MLNKPAILLRTEGAALLVASLFYYREMHSSWILFAALLLVPDVSLAGYLAGVRLGASVYNIVHTLVGPFALIAYSAFGARFSLLPFALIWTAHIGMDRMFGFGLKYPTRFNETHLQRV